MSDVSNIYGNMGASYGTTYTQNTKANAAKEEVNDSTSAGKKSYISGKTIGNPKLSEKAEKYYEELKKKFSNMDFILVSENEKQNARANAASYAQTGKMVVLVDENKIERMAEDSSYRAQIEGLIEKSASGMSQFAESVTATGAKVKGFGIQVNDNGTTSLFAVLEKSTKDQAKRIEAKRVKNRAEKKEAAKKEAKKAREEKIKENIDEAKESRSAGKYNKAEKPDEIVVTASSWDELLRKIEDYSQTEKADSVFTDAERTVGQSIDFSV